MMEMSNEQVNVKDKIKEWLEKEGFFVEETDNENTLFNFILEYPINSGRKVLILQPKDKEDSIQVICDLVISEKHRKNLKNMEKMSREKFFWELRYGLLAREGFFQLIPNEDDLRLIRVRQNIYYDSLTKGKLMETLLENHKCTTFVIWKFAENFGY
ncbi:MAG: DUF2299 domain-containing protein [Candidatus Hydrothermarchaeota archaeon]